MPTLRFHGVDREKVCSLSKALIGELAVTFNVPEDYLCLEVIESCFVMNGEIIEGYPVVEIVAFKREDNILDAAALIVTNHLKEVGYDYCEVIYNFPIPRYYYCDGKSCE